MEKEFGNSWNSSHKYKKIYQDKFLFVNGVLVFKILWELQGILVEKSFTSWNSFKKKNPFERMTPS